MSAQIDSKWPAWFALTVKPRHEKTVEKQLRILGLDPFLPLYRSRRSWSDRSKTLDLCLFPGYVFCHFGYESRLRVLNQASVTSIVGFGKEPAPVPEREIESIRRLLASGRALSPWPYLRAGQQVRINRGALEGVSGTLLRERDEYRVVVSIELLQRSVAVEIDREMLSRLTREAPRSGLVSAAAYA